VVPGDSTGGNLVLALLRYIGDYARIGGVDLPSPRGAIAWSPWVNITPAAVAAYRRSAKNSTDLVPWQILAWGLDAYSPSAAEASPAMEGYISPLQHPYATRTPLVVQAGSAEIFCDDIRAFSRGMARVGGNRVKYWETPHAPHDLALCGKLLGMVRETSDAADVASGFFEANL
jgi:acetyl esterase/lipase